MTSSLTSSSSSFPPIPLPSSPSDENIASSCLSSSSSSSAPNMTNTTTLLPSSSLHYSSDIYRTPLQPRPHFDSDLLPPSSSSSSHSHHHHHYRRRRRNRDGAFSCCFCRGRCCWCGMRMSVTIISNMLSLLPVFVGFGLMGAAHLSYGYTNFTNIFIGLVCLGLDFLLYYRRLIRVFPKQIGLANPVLSILCTILAFTTSDVVMKRWSGVLSLIVLTSGIIIGYLTRHPLRLELYQDLVPLSIWNSPTHRATLYDLAYRSTLVYIYSFCSLIVFNLVIALLSHCPEDGNCDLFGQTWLHLVVAFLTPLVVFTVAHRHMDKTIPKWQVACGYDEEAEKEKAKHRRRDRKRKIDAKDKSEGVVVETGEEQRNKKSEGEMGNQEDGTKKQKEDSEAGQFQSERISVLVHGDYLRKDSTEEESEDDYDDDEDDDDEEEEDEQTHHAVPATSSLNFNG